MVTLNRYANRTLTLTSDELQNPALMLAAMLRQGFEVSADSPISVLGGGTRNPALIIWQTVKHMTSRELQIDALVKRESVLSDYYSVLRDSEVKKENIYARVDSARQFYIQTGKHDAKVMNAIKGIASEQIEESERESRRQTKRGDSAPTALSPTLDSVYTVNDSSKLIVKVTKVLANGDYRVAMVSGEVLPQGSKVMLSGVATHFTVGAIVGKNMTLTSKSLGQRVAESQAQAATPAASNKRSKGGRVAGMGSKTPAQAATPLSVEERMSRLEDMLMQALSNKQ